MSDHKIRRITRAELVILAVIVGVLAFLWSFVRDPNGPRGDPIPAQPPSEVNRQHNPLGFSIVMPVNWTCATTAGELAAVPRTHSRFSRRSKAMIVVSWAGRDRPTDIEDFQRTTFRGQKAYEVMRIMRRWTFDDGAFSEYTLYVRHADDWYKVRYGIAEERTTLPDIIRQYISTLQWDDDLPAGKR